MIRYLVLGLMSFCLFGCEFTEEFQAWLDSGGGTSTGSPGFGASSAAPQVPNIPSEDILDIPPEDLANVPVEALIKASRDVCTAPCPVFFDAISDLPWDEIESSKFTWAFSDGATAEGFMAAHVFELPEGKAATTFEATLVVELDGFLVARDTHTVTVRPPQGRTICVAKSNFSGCPSGAAADHFTDVGAAWNAIETNGRILFRRGDLFSSGFNYGSTVPGPVHVGAFGDPNSARPALVQSGGSWDIDSEWSVTDLEISGAGMGGTLFTMDGVHALLMRSHAYDAGAAFTFAGGYDSSIHKFVINNTMTDMDGTNYIAGGYFAIVGNHIERWSSQHHTIRVAGAKQVLIANNALISNVGHNALTVRGSQSGNRPGSDYVLVQGNLMMQKATVHPQNATSNEWLRHVIWERNVHVPHDSQTSLQEGLRVNGDDMVIRNNIFYQIRRAITLETHPLTGASKNIHVYQNTHFVDQDKGSTHYFCDAESGATGTVIKNNLAMLYGNAPHFVSVESSAVVDNNFSYTPARSGECERPDGSSTCTDPKLMNTGDLSSATFMRPEAGSLAIDAAVDAPVSEDFHGTPRPQGGAPDVGAVERIE